MAGGAAHLTLILGGFTLRDLGLSAGTESGGGLGGSFDMTDLGTLWATAIRSRLTEHLACPAGSVSPAQTGSRHKMNEHFNFGFRLSN